MQTLIRVLITALLVCTAATNLKAAGCDNLSSNTPMKAFVLCLVEYRQRTDLLTDEIMKLKSDIMDLMKLKSDIVDLKTALYNDIDAVYTISETFTPLDIKNLGTGKRLIFHQYIFADLERHDVRVVIARRQNIFGVRFCINDFCSIEKNDIDQDITKVLKEHPLKGTNAGVEWSKTSAFPEHIQKIEFEPFGLNWDAAGIASLDGYIMVKRVAGGNRQASAPGD
jgi:hypothetical protein